MYGDAMLAAEVEHRLREQVYRREMADPERRWAIEADLDRPALAIDLGGLGRAVRAVALALVRTL